MTALVRNDRKAGRWGPPPPQFPLFPVDTGPTSPALIDCARTDKWIEQFLSIVNTNVPATSVRLKVAVLATGIDLDHPDFYDQDRIRNTRNWVNNATIADSNGHGTHVVSTILSLTQNVDVYVAKVSEGNSDTLESVDYVAEAIRVATEEWDVDMISIPFGLPRLVPVIQDEIDKAVYRKKIIFAAASDNGANTGRSYPANQPGVICVHSTDGLANASNFNPTALAATDNFCVPGEHINAAWPSPSPTTQLGGTRRMSGSATATSVAVAIAALMIAFLSNNMPEEECPVRLKSYAGIRAVFRSLSEQRNGCYDTVNPVRAFGLGRFQDREMILGQVRAGLNT
jgi:subtilisin family serine protease